MRSRRAVAATVALLCLLGPSPADPAASALGGVARAEGGSSVSACIRSWGEARYGAVGYNHVVHIADACDAPAECAVSTDVNPEVQRVTVPGRGVIEVVTFLGSPARVFVPRVECTMRAP